MDTLTKPRQFRLCLFLMIAMLVYTIGECVSILMAIIVRSSPGNGSVPHTVFFLSSMSFFGFVIYKISDGRAWARIIWSLMFIIGIFIQLSSIGSDSATDLIRHVIEDLFDVFILYLLWHPATTRWFKDMKVERREAVETPPVGKSHEP
jgi:hypothetical protein